MYRILGISGSLRTGSYNTAALRAAGEIAPDDMKVEIHPLNDLPMYNADVERQIGFPPAVEEFRDAIREADALLIATPEYNYSMTGALKNAIDWASRGGDESPLNHKPAAILGAGGRFGTLRSQLHLREVLAHNQLRVVAQPQVLIDRPWEKYDEGPRLVDERARDQIRRLIDALRAEIERGS